MKTAIALGLALLLTGCQTLPQTEPSTAAWQSGELSQVHLNSSALDVALVSVRNKTVAGRFRIQDSQWRGDSGWPRIRLIVHDLTASGQTFASDNPFDAPLDQRISKAFADFALELGEPRSIDNAMGPANVQRFVVNDANHCLFIGQFTQPSNELRAGSGTELGQVYIEGSLCGAPGNGLSESSVIDFVQGLEISSTR